MSTPVLSETGKFPREARVRYPWEFRRIHREGVRVHTPHFTIVARTTLGENGARFGCAISRKVGNAVVRNRVRRLLKEMFRRCRSCLPPVDLVFIAKPEAGVLARGCLEDVAAELLEPMGEAASRAQDPRRSRGARKQKK